MKFYLFIFSFFVFSSCVQDKKTNSGNTQSSEDIKDTILIKKQKPLSASFEVGFYSRSYYYYWLAGKDTLDLTINVTEYEKDSTFSVSVHHKKPLLFKMLLYYINECFPLIKKDFNMAKFRSIYLKSPVYYLDLTIELSREYEQKFGRKNINYQKLNKFLLTSSLNIQIDNFLSPLNKKVKRYSIEKFHLINKTYFNALLPNTDLKDYPEFAIEGMGLSVELENK